MCVASSDENKLILVLYAMHTCGTIDLNLLTNKDISVHLACEDIIFTVFVGSSNAAKTYTCIYIYI